MDIGALIRGQKLAQSQFAFQCKGCKSDNVHYQNNNKAICLECGDDWHWEPIQISTPPPPERSLSQNTHNRETRRGDDDELRRAQDEDKIQRVWAWLDKVEPDDKPLERPWQEDTDKTLIIPKRRKRDIKDTTEPTLDDDTLESTARDVESIDRSRKRGINENDTLKPTARDTESTDRTRKQGNKEATEATEATRNSDTLERTDRSRYGTTLSSGEMTTGDTRAPSTTGSSSPILVSRAPAIIDLTRERPTMYSVTREPPTTVNRATLVPTVRPMLSSSRGPTLSRASLSARALNIPTPLVNQKQEIRPSLDITKDDIPTSILTNLQPNIHRYPPTSRLPHKNPLHTPLTPSPLSGRQASCDENNDNNSSPSLAELAHRHRQQKAAMLLRCPFLKSPDI